jgi:predicted ABC-type ATPase
MSYLFNKPDQLDIAPGKLQTKREGTFVENLYAQYESSRLNDVADGEFAVLKDQWGPIVDTMRERIGKESVLHSSLLFGRQKMLPSYEGGPIKFTGLKTEFTHINPANYLSPSVTQIGVDQTNNEMLYRKKSDQLIKIIKENPETFPDLQWVSHDELLERGINQAKENMKDLEDISARSPGMLSGLARLAGGVGAAFTDPINIETSVVGGAKTLLGRVFEGAIIGAGVEAYTQEGVKEWYETLGLEYTPEQFWTSVAAGGVFGGGAPIAFNIAGKTINFTSDQMRSGYKAFTDSGFYKPSKTDEAALKAIENIEEDINSNPITDLIEHEERLETSVRAVEDAEIPNFPDEPRSDVKPPTSVYDSDTQGPGYERFNPDEIEVDAKTFQFKEGGDESGVTERLQGVEKWIPEYSGIVLVYEFADGKRFIADGHQRLALAKRIKAKDPSQNVELPGYLLREVDGITPEQARVQAASKNIAEGSGTAIDAAKILRGDPKRIGDLPPRSSLVRIAQDLRKLSDDDFGAVINGVIEPKYAAIVAQLIPDNQQLQSNAIKILNKTDPSNVVQAEAIVRQIREADADTAVQETLFGDEIVQESYYTERSVILDKTIKQLRQDKSAFQNLVRNSDRLESEGNKLAKNANERRASNDSQAIAYLQKIANKKGPLSDSLTDQAKLARSTGNYTDATRNFIDVVRGGIERGDFDGVQSSNVGRAIDVEAQSRASENVGSRAVEDFDEPGGVGAKAQADQLQQDQNDLIQEAMQPDVQLRQDLQKTIDDGASNDVIDSHPAVINALEQAMAIPETHTRKGYLTFEWTNSREFKFGDQDIVGYDNAVIQLYKDAQTLAWRDDGIDVPVNPVKNERKAVIVLGPPASGKSSVANPIARKLNAAILDSDEAKKTLPDYQNGIGANAVHVESQLLTNMVEDIVKDQGINIVIPTVGSNRDKIYMMMRRFQKAGYDVTLFDMVVSAENARIRMYNRFIKTGRLIPPKYLDEVGDNPTTTYDKLKEQKAADGYVRLDNNGDINEPKILLEDTKNLLEGADISIRSRGRGGPGAAQESRIQRDGEEDLAEIGRLDIDEEIPIALEVDENNNTVAKTTSMRKIQEEIEQDEKMLARFKECVK